MGVESCLVFAKVITLLLDTFFPIAPFSSTMSALYALIAWNYVEYVRLSNPYAESALVHAVTRLRAGALILVALTRDGDGAACVGEFKVGHIHSSLKNFCEC